MYRLLLTIALLFLLLLSSSQQAKDGQKSLQLYLQGEHVMKEVDRLLALPASAAIDQKILDGYNKAVKLYREAIAKINTGQDSLSFFLHLHLGLVEHYLDKTEEARIEYRTAMGIKPKQISDSFLFKPFLFTGSIFFSNEGNVDSAEFYYKTAQRILDMYPVKLEESERLFNRLGVLYYEAGNYRQARNYFEKAIALITPGTPGGDDLKATYQLNIAAMLVKTEEDSAAMKMYQQVAKLHIHEDEVNQNLGIIALKRGDYHSALTYFKKVNYASGRKNIEFFLNKAMAFAALQQKDSTAFYLLRSEEENTKWNGTKPNASNALLLKFKAENYLEQHDYKKAIDYYQGAIAQLSPSISPTAIFQNPSSFTGIFSYIQLFNLLNAKGNALILWYNKDARLEYLTAALAAFESAYALTDYIEKTYNSDEARLFLNHLKYQVHDQPINISLRLFELTKDKKYIEFAYRFDQRNKATVLLYNVEQNELRQQLSEKDSAIREQEKWRSNVTRLSFKAAQSTDNLQLRQIQDQIREAEIKLGRLTEQIRAKHVRQEADKDPIPSLQLLQRQLDAQTAVLSFHVGDSALICFIIQQNSLQYQKTFIAPSFTSQLDSFKKILQASPGEDLTSQKRLGKQVYEKTMRNLVPLLKDIDRLVIIPDAELTNLPFEALQDEDEVFLINKYSIQYQYTTALLNIDKSRDQSSATLAIAPFATLGSRNKRSIAFNSLPGSKEEIEGLKGLSLIDDKATKENLLENVNSYPILHLATHAVANNMIPLNSFIAFYPGDSSSKLYAGEIYSLHLDSVKLAILSACETAAGPIIKGEGVMSISRAFAYAGCPNMITSLWKAEDETTAFIMQRIHVYLRKGETRDHALQHAQLDLLEEPSISPRLKLPNFWAHLVLIGNYQPEETSNSIWWVVGFGAIIIIALIIYVVMRRR